MRRQVHNRRLGKVLQACLVLLPLALLCAACDTGGNTTTTGNNNTTTGGNTTATGGNIITPIGSALSSVIGNAISAVAQTLQEHLFGYRANLYSPTDPAWKDAFTYWSQTCHNTDGTLCDEAKSGSLQCVEFVTGTYGAANDPLPAVGNGNQFWGLYANRAGWQEIPNGQMPYNGDIAAWSGGEFGHVAIVVGARAPQGGTNGYVRVAEANAPGTAFPGSVQPGNFYTMTWTANGVETWPGYQLLGFIHQTSGQSIIPHDLLPLVAATGAKLASSLNTPAVGTPMVQKVNNTALPALTGTQLQWESLTMQEANRFQLPATYFTKQINQESGFQTNALSRAGATGIAQFEPSTAAGIPRCVTDLNAPADCAATAAGMQQGKGIDPNNPQQALPGAAYYMSQLFAHYLTMSTGYTEQDRSMAYARAVAAYNSGQGTVDNAVASCGSTWLNCIDQQQSKNETIDYHETRDYVQVILGCPVVQAAGATCDQKILDQNTVSV